MKETQTNWDFVVSDKELLEAKKLRSKTFVECKASSCKLPELVADGWEESRRYKNPKFVKIRKNKSFDERFEDRVWMLFAQMGFTHMNKDRHFKMSYDYHNPNFTQQIDIFAADDETVIIVECKAAEKQRDAIFKKELEAFHGQMQGLRREAKEKFPNANVKFIWATQNYIISRTDQTRMKEWGIYHFSETVVGYYYELIKHLGTCARYQLLGNLFAKQEIRNMDDKIPAIEGKMGGHTYYSFSIEPERLLKIGYILHRNEANKDMMPTYQRLIKKKRLSEVQNFINSGGYFPNSLIISIDSNGKGLQFDPSNTKVDNAISRLGVLHLPKMYRSAYIIDGQHRLYGYSNSKYASTNCIPVVAFVDLDRQEQIKLFMDINENQKAVPKSLRVTLSADMLWDSPDYNDRRKALCSKIAQMFGEESSSPLMGRVLIGEDEKTSIKCITISAIEKALRNCNFMTLYKNNIICKDGTFDVGTNDATCNLLYPFLEECLCYIRKAVLGEWDRNDDNGILTINRGIQAIIRVINDIVNHLVDNKIIFPKRQKTAEILPYVIPYLEPLTIHLNNIPEQERKELRSFLGTGADTRFWRTFQREIAKCKSDFNPEGLRAYWENESKTYNIDSATYIEKIEVWIKSTIKNALSAKYGVNWEIKGIPHDIYINAQNLCAEKNYSSISSGEDLALSLWDFISLKDCPKIVTHARHWTELFEKSFTRPEEINISGGKKAKIEWLRKVSEIQSSLGKSSYSVSESDFTFIKDVYIWISQQ